MLQYCYGAYRKKGKKNIIKPFQIKLCFNCQKKIEEINKSYVAIVSENKYWFCSNKCWELCPKPLKSI